MNIGSTHWELGSKKYAAYAVSKSALFRLDPDKLWIALLGGSKVVCCDPATGMVIAEIPLPAKNTTSCCFAGEKLDTLIITSSWEGFDNPEAGQLFFVKVGVQGMPNVPFDDSWVFCGIPLI